MATKKKSTTRAAKKTSGKAMKSASTKRGASKKAAAKGSGKARLGPKGGGLIEPTVKAKPTKPKKTTRVGPKGGGTIDPK